MSHTYSCVHVHCIFSTKERRDLIAADRMPTLLAYLRSIAAGEGFALHSAGGTANHLHLLLELPPAVALAPAVQKLKGNSSKWMGPEFAWQQGYGAFSVSVSQLPVVERYIQSQEEHHQRQSFEDEFVQLLRSCGVEYDPQHVFG